jgi:hypothetical protein
LPTFGPGPGMQATCDPVTVTITTPTAGANIRYTLDGTTPTETNGILIAASSGTASVVPTATGYMGYGMAPAEASGTHTSASGGSVSMVLPLLVETPLKAIAFKTGWQTSGVTTGTYTCSGDPCVSPGFGPCLPPID